jgi:hypothetical protein
LRFALVGIAVSQSEGDAEKGAGEKAGGQPRGEHELGELQSGDVVMAEDEQVGEVGAG